MNEAMRADSATGLSSTGGFTPKAETDAKAREAYQALGRVMMGR
jgi:hypothetical protein